MLISDLALGGLARLHDSPEGLGPGVLGIHVIRDVHKLVGTDDLGQERNHVRLGSQETQLHDDLL